MSVLRSVSPIHIEYLQNMGVGASMSVSILRDGKLWGLFACHHYSPRHISFERRTAAELFGQMFSWILEGRERETDVAYEDARPSDPGTADGIGRLARAAASARSPISSPTTAR